MTDQNADGLLRLTKEHGDVELDGVQILKVGLAWERIAQPGEDSSIGKAKGWWKQKKRDGKGETDPADMDAGALFFAGGTPTKYLGFGNNDPMKDEPTQPERTSATTTGDSITGAGDGDDETLKFVLADIPQRFDRILIVVGAHKPGSKMSAVHDLKATVYDGTGGSDQAVGVVEQSLLETHEMLAVADVKKVGGRWFFTVNGGGFTPTKGDIRSLLRQAMNVVGS